MQNTKQEEGEVNWLTLPWELWSVIFSRYVYSNKTRGEVSLVCKLWSGLVWSETKEVVCRMREVEKMRFEKFGMLKSLEIECSYGVVDLVRYGSCLENMESLKCLGLRGVDVRTCHLPKLKQITQLRIYGMRFIDEKLFEDHFDHENMQSFTLEVASISKIPKMIQDLPWKSLYSLSFKGNSIKQIFEFKSPNFQKLTHLDLSRNCISSIQLISNLTTLTDLNVSSNRILDLPSSFGESLTKLQVLRIDKNRILRIPPSFSLLQNLRFLDFSFNCLRIFPENEIGNLISLEFLHFSDNKELCEDTLQLNLEGIKNSVTKLTNLKDLKFDQNKIVPSNEITEFMVNFNKLTRINLADNQLEKFPFEVTKIDKLLYLNLARNKIHKLPKHLTLFTDLNTLNLQNNQLTDINFSNFKMCAKLSRLRLNNNKIINISSEISVLHSLRLLSLSNNQIQTLPKELSALIRLRRFSIRGNNLRDLKEDITGLTKLTFLDVSDNKDLIEIPEAITRMTKLKFLFIPWSNPGIKIPNLTGLTRLISKEGEVSRQEDEGV